MDHDLNEFIDLLKKEDRALALDYVLKLKAARGLTVMAIYEDLLTPSLNEMVPTGDENIDIWREHIRTSIIRTIMENLVPYLKEEQLAHGLPKNKTVAVLCPPEEYHEIGARMAADILTIAGYRTIYVGSNTPFRVFQAGLAAEAIDYVAISISNPYHLVSTRRIIDGIRSGFPSVRIVLGGSAILEHPDMAEVLKPDHIATTLGDLTRLEGGNDHGTGL